MPLQVRRPERPDKPQVDVQVGLDFGTSSTKIAYRRAVGGGNVVPLVHNHGLGHYPEYCLPSVACFNDREELLLGADAAAELAEQPWGSGFRCFKVLVAGRADRRFRDSNLEDEHSAYESLHRPILPEVLTALYLAHAMRVARKALETSGEFESYRLNVLYNICMPIEHVENNPAREAFEQIAAAAESIARWLPDGPLALENLRRAERDCAQAPADRGDPRVFIVPEAVAQTRAYQESLDVRRGIHAVVDLGAGTTDVSIFNMRHINVPLPEGRFGSETIQHWYAARNVPRGVRAIERLAGDWLANRNGGQARDAEVLSLLGRGVNDGIAVKARRKLESIHMQAADAWREAYRRYRENVQQGAQRAFSGDAVRIFICGGGALLPHSEEVFSRSWMPSWGPYAFLPLTRPRDFDASGVNDAAPFDRMAVAYGLSFPTPGLREYCLPQDVPPGESYKPPEAQWKTYGIVST